MVTIDRIEMLAYSLNVEVVVRDGTMGGFPTLLVDMKKGSILHKFEFIQELEELKPLGLDINYGKDNWLLKIYHKILIHRLCKRHTKGIC